MTWELWTKIIIIIIIINNNNHNHNHKHNHNQSRHEKSLLQTVGFTPKHYNTCGVSPWLVPMCSSTFIPRMLQQRVLHLVVLSLGLSLGLRIHFGHLLHWPGCQLHGKSDGIFLGIEMEEVIYKWRILQGRFRWSIDLTRLVVCWYCAKIVWLLVMW